MNSIVNKKKYSILINIFWIFLFLFLDFGGFQKGLFESNIFGKVNFYDALFVVLLFIYAFIPKPIYSSNRIIRSFFVIYGLWLLYYIFIYGYVNNSSSFLTFLLKSRSYYYNLIVMYFVSVIIQRDSRIFFRYLIFFSFFVIGLLMLTILLRVDLIPILTVDRQLFEGTRRLLYNYSLMPLLIPIGFVVFFFKTRITESNLLKIGAGLMILTWVLSLTRRHLVFAILYLLIIYIMSLRMRQVNLLRIIPFIRMLIVPVILIYILFPKYVSSTVQAFAETVSIVKTGETTSGRADQRLSLTERKFIISMIGQNPFFGTGYEKRWSTRDGDRQGYEASDYPFLGAIAMYGFVGLLCYLPIYFFIYGGLFKIFKKMRQFGIQSVLPNYYDQLLFFSLFAVYFLELLIYVNYFSLATSPSSSISGSLFVQLGLLFGMFQKVQLNAQLNNIAKS